MEFNPARLVSISLLLLAVFCAWIARRDLDRGETNWFAWSRLARPASRRAAPFRYWLAMLLNILVVLIFAVAGAAAMRAGFVRFGR